MRLLLLLLPIAFFTKADMDYICEVSINKGSNDSWFELDAYINKECERNNIIVFYGSTKRSVFNYAKKGETPYLATIPFEDLVTYFCRFDRNVNDYQLNKLIPKDFPNLGSWNNYNTTTEMSVRYISCVLYDGQPRRLLGD